MVQCCGTLVLNCGSGSDCGTFGSSAVWRNYLFITVFQQQKNLYKIWKPFLSMLSGSESDFGTGIHPCSGSGPVPQHWKGTYLIRSDLCLLTFIRNAACMFVFVLFLSRNSDVCNRNCSLLFRLWKRRRKWPLSSWPLRTLASWTPSGIWKRRSDIGWWRSSCGYFTYVVL